MVIMNFSGVYEKEAFYLEEKYNMLDLKSIPGTNSYCDEDASKAIAKAIEIQSFQIFIL